MFFVSDIANSDYLAKLQLLFVVSGVASNPETSSLKLEIQAKVLISTVGEKTCVELFD